MNIGNYLSENYSTIEWNEDMKRIVLNGCVISDEEMNELASKVKQQDESLGKIPEKEIIKAIKNSVKRISKESKQAPKTQRTNIDWMKGMDMSDKGVAIDSAKNNRLLFENHPEFQGKFVYNEMIQEELYDEKPLTDVILSELKIHAEELLGGNRSMQNIKSAVLVTCDSHHINPLKKKLLELNGYWDGTERLETLFIKAFDCDDSLYIREVTKQLFYAWINRMLHPGCIFNMIFMFEGAQGIGKSELLMRMLKLIDGKGVDGMKFRDDRSTLEKISSHQLCLFDELGNMSKADLEFIKEFISRSTDSFDKKYRPCMTFPRNCILVGNLNPDRKAFLKDVTLDFERRFIIIPCHAKGIAEMPEKSDPLWWNEFLPDEYLLQIWAEAYYKVTHETDFNWQGWSQRRVEEAKVIQKEYSSLNNDDVFINELEEVLGLLYDEKTYLDYDNFKAAVDVAKARNIPVGEKLYQVKISVLRQYMKLEYREDRSRGYFTAMMKKLGWEEAATTYWGENDKKRHCVDVYRRIEAGDAQLELL